MRFSFENYTMPLLLLLGVSTAGLWLQEPTLSLLSTAGVLWIEAELVGKTLLPGRPRAKRLAAGAFVLTSGFAVLASAIYLGAGLTREYVAALWLVVGLACLLLGLRQDHAHHQPEAAFWQGQVRSLAPLLIALAVVAADLLAVACLMGGATDAAIHSPWLGVHPLFFFCIAIASAGIATLAHGQSRRLAMTVGVLHALVLLSVATVVYTLGYGFDTFIHQRTENDILQLGAVFPKTPYYVGQYVLVVLISHLTHLPITLWDRLLVPAGYAVLTPLLLAWTAQHASKDAHTPSAPAILLAFLFPFSAFIVTTPQGLSYLFFLATLATVFALRPQPIAYLIAAVGTAATMAVHPLTGIPLLGLILFLFGRDRTNPPMRLLIAMGGAAIVVFGVPLAFLLNQRLGSELGISFSFSLFPTLLQEARNALISLLPTGSAWLDMQSYWKLAAPVTFAGLSFLTWRTARPRWKTMAMTAAAGTALFTFAFLVLSIFRFSMGGDTGALTFPFRFRMLEMALLLLLLAAAPGFAHLWHRLMRTPLLRLVSVFGVSVLVAANVSAAYPRTDRVVQSKGYAVSAATFEAVEWIEQAATGPHIVLGNQTDAAAAIERFGFAAYYAGNFYYSHESSAADLYAFFWDMNAAPTRTTAEAAGTFAGVDTVFFVVHDYWRQSSRITAEAQKTADEMFVTRDGTVAVFVYTKN